MTEDIQIRTAGPEDVDALVESSRGLFAEDAGTHDPTMNQRWPDDFGHDFLMRAITAEDRLTLVACATGSVIGHLTGALRPPTEIRTMLGAELVGLYVQPAYRSSGVGSQLIEQFLAWARERGAKRAVVEAFAANTRARALYERHGFAALEVSHAQLL